MSQWFSYAVQYRSMDYQSLFSTEIHTKPTLRYLQGVSMLSGSVDSSLICHNQLSGGKSSSPTTKTNNISFERNTFIRTFGTSSQYFIPACYLKAWQPHVTSRHQRQFNRIPVLSSRPEAKFPIYSVQLTSLQQDTSSYFKSRV